VVRAALASGQNVNQRSPSGVSGLMYAASGSHDDIVELLLLQPGVDINSPDSSVLAGGTPLHWACSRSGNNRGLARLLAQPGMASLDVLDSNGCTPLMLAVRRGGVDSVRQLVASMFLIETQVIIETIMMIRANMFLMKTQQRTSFGYRLLSSIDTDSGHNKIIPSTSRQQLRPALENSRSETRRRRRRRALKGKQWGRARGSRRLLDTWWRARLCKLNPEINRWQDDVTGFVSVVVQRLEGVFLVLRPEAAVREEAAVLRTKLTANSSFDKQEEHFLVWKHQENGVRCTLGLAFENGEGRDEIWDKIQSIQNNAFSLPNPSITNV